MLISSAFGDVGASVWIIADLLQRSKQFAATHKLL
jgi:hypothetical protein